MKEKVESFVGLFLTIILTISVVLIFLSIGLWIFIGVAKVGSYFNLISLNLYPTIFSNALYLGWLLILIYITLIFLEMIVRILMKNIEQSLKKNIVSYSIQILIATILIKILIDNYFDRIEVSFLGVSIGVFILYLIDFFSSKAHKGIDDLEE